MLAPDAPSVDVPNLATIPASRSDRRAAIAVALLLCAMAIAGSALRTVAGPSIPAIVAIDQPLMAAAYLLTSYLLFSQFVSSGLLVLATVGAGYAFVGLMQIPFLIVFPDVFIQGQLVGGLASPFWLGITFHLVFPLIVVGPILFNRPPGTAIDERVRRLSAWFAMTLVACVVALIFAASVSGIVPALYAQRTFAPYYFPLALAASALNFAGCVLCLVYTRLRTMLQTWLSVALFGMGLDQLCYAISPSRFVMSWYFSKGVALVTALIVLVVVLHQISALYRRVTELATIDQLTNLPNRRTLEAQLDWIVRYGQRHGITLAAVMIDVDHFKAYNDAYGHAAGDEVLRHIADTLRANVLRSSDLVARYGGEEFVALLPDATREGTTLAVERMRTAVERRAIPHESGLGGRVTISAGAAVGVIGETGPRELLRAADEALYTAKAQGRNQCVVVTCGAGTPATPAARPGLWVAR